MRNDRGSLRTSHVGWFAGLFALVWMLGCGDDSSDEDGAAGAPAVCTVGQTETGCTCSNDQPPGFRRCSDAGQWMSCTCPPPGSEDRCSPGDQIRCRICPGETERRVTTCLEGGTYDCSCRGDGAVPSGDAGP